MDETEDGAQFGAKVHDILEKQNVSVKDLTRKVSSEQIDGFA